MELGAFSISLAVKDLAVSSAFYVKLGFERTGGGENWSILRNGGHMIGLFQGMFDRNMLTFNPGFGQDMTQLSTFTDVRELQSALEASGIALASRADADTSGPAQITLIDPDGNLILIDQFWASSPDPT